MQVIRGNEASLRGSRGLDLDTSKASASRDADASSATATATAERGCRETSLQDLLRLLTSYALRSSLFHPSAVPVFASTSTAAAAACSSSSSSASNKTLRDQILSECASFCLGIGAPRVSNAKDSSPQFTTSFLAEVEISLVSAYSQRGSARSHKRSVLRSVTHCLAGVVEVLIPRTGSDHVNTASLSGILRVWTAVLSITASEGSVNPTDAADDSPAPAVLNRAAQESVLKVVDACLPLLGYGYACGLDFPYTSCGSAIKESALRSHPKREISLGAASSSGDRHARTDSLDGGMTTDNSDRGIPLEVDAPHVDSPDSEVSHSIIVFFLSVLSSYSALMPSSDPLLPSEERRLDCMVSAVFSSLLLSCHCRLKLRDRAIETPSYLSPPLGDEDSSLNHTPCPHANRPTTGIPVFHDVFPLIGALLSDEPRIFRTALRVVNSAECSEEIHRILLRIEVSSACMQGSEFDISDSQLYSEDCTVTPFLYLLYSLARSSVLGADTVISLCAGTWESLRELLQKAKTSLNHFETDKGKNSINAESPLSDTAGVASLLLAYLHVSGDLGELWTDTKGGFVIQILYGALQDERTCDAARKYVLQLKSYPTAESTHAHVCCVADEFYGDLSEYFSSPVSAACATHSYSHSPSGCGYESMQVDDADSSAVISGMGLAITSLPRGPGERDKDGDGDSVPNGSDQPGWDLGSIFIKALQYKLSYSLDHSLESSVLMPRSLIPCTEQELEGIIGAVSSFASKTVN